jgi:type II secretory pathway predicted ATPase ExeA
MYESYWKLTDKPFEDRLTSRFYYPSSTHQTALLKILYAIENRREVVVLCGPSGVGKSLIQDQLRAQLPEFVGPVISLPYPDLDRDQLLAYLAMQLSDEADHQQTSPALSIRQIENAIRKASLAKKQILLLIEEAEWMEARGGFEALRLLLNLAKAPVSANGTEGNANESSIGQAGLTILMNGQPSLLPQLERQVSFNQRIAARCVLNRFNVEETYSYITHRLRAAGGSADQIFDSAAIDSIHFLTDGVPRRINNLCDMLLMVGYAQESPKIYPTMVEEVHRDLTPVYAS